jgi:hypothetical protein
MTDLKTTAYQELRERLLRNDLKIKAPREMIVDLKTQPTFDKDKLKDTQLALYAAVTRTDKSMSDLADAMAWAYQNSTREIKAVCDSMALPKEVVQPKSTKDDREDLFEEFRKIDL